MVQLFRLNEHVIEGSGNFTDFFGTDQALMDDGPFIMARRSPEEMVFIKSVSCFRERIKGR